MQQAGDDVHVEQLSTIVEGSGTHVGMVFDVFSAVDRLGSSLASGAIAMTAASPLAECRLSHLPR